MKTMKTYFINIKGNSQGLSHYKYIMYQEYIKIHEAKMGRNERRNEQIHTLFANSESLPTLMDRTTTKSYFKTQVDFRTL